MSRKNRKRKKKNKKITILFIIVALLGGTFGAYGYSILDKIKNTEITKDDESLGIIQNNKNNKITNIVLFGVDRRESSDTPRSDTVMIASIDKKHNKIKLTSLMRDTYLEIPGKGMNKLTHAYAYGGPELAIQTINQNFDMNIRDFVSVDFYGLEAIIDTLGGIQIDVKDYEVNALNHNIKEINRITDPDSPFIQSAGLQTLNGRQAVAYARIRKVGNGDYQRTERQRAILEQILNKTMNSGVTQYPKLLNTMLPYVETSLSKAKIVSLGLSSVISGINEIEQYRIPADGHVYNDTINGVSYVVPNTLEDNVKLLHQFIYDDVK
ncbi:LCP family protein [Garciella nitratireducens]|uniref:LCP family protein n=1 Tax=Garciella nitratireducens TaxID=218205 RepID=UPI001BD6B943|nr:LCP family protein [Garciella nitratireducens]